MLNLKDCCLNLKGLQGLKITQSGPKLLLNYQCIDGCILPSSRNKRNRTPSAYDFNSGLTVLKVMERDGKRD